MEAILYICHGSRVKTAREQAITFITKCMERSLAPINEYCFLELAAPSIEEAFNTCVQKGATKIIAIPVLLLTAAHAKVDIPNELARLSAQFPNINLEYGRPIGVHRKMVDTLIERIVETGEEYDKNSMVLLVGRGSSDPEVKNDLNEIAEMLRRKTGVKQVQTCFLTATSPSLEDGLEIMGESGHSKVFVIPYLLFTGILMNHINKVIKNHPQSEKFILCNYLGYHSNIESVIRERVLEITA